MSFELFGNGNRRWDRTARRGRPITVCLKVILTALLIPTLGSCKKPQSDIIIHNVQATLEYDSRYHGNEITLRIENRNSYYLCFIKDEINPTFGIMYANQGKGDIKSQLAIDGHPMMFNGENMTNGIMLIEPGKNNYYIDLSDFQLKDGKFKFDMSIKVTKCREIFTKTPIP